VPADLQVWSFLTARVGTGIIIAWAVICSTYLIANFRNSRRYGVKGVKEAQSLLQPWLAAWGLFWSVMICTTDALSLNNSQCLLKDSSFVSASMLVIGLFQDNCRGFFSVIIWDSWPFSCCWDCIGWCVGVMLSHRQTCKMRSDRRVRRKIWKNQVILNYQTIATRN